MIGSSLCPCCGNGVLLGRIEVATPGFRPTVRLVGETVAEALPTRNYVSGWTPTLNALVLVTVQNWQRVAITSRFT